MRPSQTALHCVEDQNLQALVEKLLDQGRADVARPANDQNLLLSTLGADRMFVFVPNLLAHNVRAGADEAKQQRRTRESRQEEKEFKCSQSFGESRNAPCDHEEGKV